MNCWYSGANFRRLETNQENSDLEFLAEFDQEVCPGVNEYKKEKLR